MVGTDSGKITVQMFAVILLLILIIHLTCQELDLKTLLEVFIHFLSNNRAKALRDKYTFHKTDMWI